MLADLSGGGGEVLGFAPPLGPILFHFHAVFGKFIEPPPVWEILDPPLPSVHFGSATNGDSHQ